MYLGIEIDSDAQVMRLSFDKIIGLQTLLRQWSHKMSCAKSELLSIICVFPAI